jgi:serine phosphatase RsbU (regulator of sigma subunit)
MNKYLVVFSLFFCLFTRAQNPVYKSFEIYLGDTINRVDQAGLNQGRWVYLGKNKKGKKFRLYKNNQIVEEGYYLNDKKSKVWKSYHNTGKLKSELTYENDIPRGPAKFYNSDGKIILEGILHDKKWVGSYSVFDSNGNKITRDTVTVKKKSYLLFAGVVQKMGKPMDGVKIVIERNDFGIDEFVTKPDGKFSFHLELDFDYTLYFSKQNFNEQLLEINTNVFNLADTTVYTLNDWKINMYDNFAASATSELFGFLINKPADRIYFSKKKKKFVADGAYVHLFKKEFKDISESTRFLLAQAAEDNKKLEIENLRIESEKKLKEIELLQKEQIAKNAEIKKKEAEINAQRLEAEKKAKDLEIFEQEKKIKELLLEQKQAEIERQQMEADQKAKELERLAILKKMQELEIESQKSALLKKNSELDEKNKQAELAAKEKELKEKELGMANQELKQNSLFMKFLLGGLFIVAVFSFFLYRNIRQKKKANELLERQAGEIEKQKNEIEEKSFLIEQKNIETEQSILYAKRIQYAILPPMSEIGSYLDDYFVLYKPKDIVSGDFYFFSDKYAHENKVIIAAVDCTGHGVPGAFMSLIGSEKLRDAVDISPKASDILYELNRGVKQSLRQSGEDNSTRDGMDLSLCVLPAKKNGSGKVAVEFSGANRPLWIIKKNSDSVTEIKATKSAIGGLTSESQPFAQNEIELDKGDTIYLFSDGYADQFGGATQKKLMTKKFKEILLSLQHLELADQKKQLDSFIEEWKGEAEQVDDILVIGYRA